MVYFFNSCYFYLFFLSNEGEVQTVLGKKSEIKVPIALDRKSKTKKKKNTNRTGHEISVKDTNCTGQRNLR